MSVLEELSARRLFFFSLFKKKIEVNKKLKNFGFVLSGSAGVFSLWEWFFFFKIFHQPTSFLIVYHSTHFSIILETYSNETGATSCKPCPSGTISSDDGTDCDHQECTYSPIEGVVYDLSPLAEESSHGSISLFLSNPLFI